MRQLTALLLLCALGASGCATYEGTFDGDHIHMAVSTDGPTFTAEGANMVGAVKRNGVVIASNAQPITGKITWKRGVGWTVERQP